MLTTLLYVKGLAELAHPGQSIDPIEFSGQMDRGLFLVIEDARVHLAAQRSVSLLFYQFLLPRIYKNMDNDEISNYLRCQQELHRIKGVALHGHVKRGVA